MATNMVYGDISPRTAAHTFAHKDQGSDQSWRSRSGCAHRAQRPADHHLTHPATKPPSPPREGFFLEIQCNSAAFAAA